MGLHVECNGCTREETLLHDASARYLPPAGWKELESYIFCAACWPHVQVAVERAVATLLIEGP